MKRPSFFTKSLIIISLAIFQLSQVLVFPLPVAEAATAEAADFEPLIVAERPRGDSGTLYDLVVLLVAKDLQNDGQNYAGLTDEFDELEEDEMPPRIIRYANDIISKNPQTDVKIMFYDPEKDSVESVAAAMENLYQNGDGSNPNQLAGLVLIGDVPLPVVNKNGNRFISMFPYTDYVDKAYVYNDESGDFERNEEVGFPKPEIWHGVIKAQTTEELATFFDKNHLYYTGNPQYADFDRKMFFGDLAHEEEQMNADVYKHYVEYLEAAEDIAYMRYNKFWASEFTQKAAADVNIDLSSPVDADNPMADAREDFAAAVGDGDSLSKVPDIYSKTVIDQFLLPYYQIFNKYTSSLNDWADSTGRYNAKDVDSVVGLISIKDDYTRYYLRSVNDALESKINRIAEKISEPLPLLETVTLTGRIGDQEDFEVQLRDWAEPQDEGDIAGVDVPGVGEGNNFVLSDEHVLRFHYLNDVDEKLYVNGLDAESLNNAKQCSVFLGSTKSEYFDENMQYNPKGVGGVYSILTRALRSDNIMTVNKVTAGVNTRLVSPEELLVLTNQAYGGTEVADGFKDTGAVIEDNPDYPIPAFIDSTLKGSDDDYNSPFQDTFEKGDVIVAINGKNIGFSNSFDNAIEKAYNEVVKVVDAINKHELENLSSFDGKLATYKEDPADPPEDAFGRALPPPPPLRILDTPEKIINDNRLKERSVESVISFLNITYYHGSERKNVTLTFSVRVNEDTDEIKFGSAQDPQGPIEVAVLPHGMADLPDGFDFDDNSDGAIFNLYDNDTLGFGGDAYDPSAGCNAKSATRNSDRCFGRIATMPVFDAGGSLAPVKMTIPGRGDVLKFPVNVKKDNAYVNSGRPEDYENAVDEYAFPENKKFDDVDEVILDSCYGTGLPSYSMAGGGGVNIQDSNLYTFPLDPTTGPPDVMVMGVPVTPSPLINRDFYGRLLRGFGEFVTSNLSDEPDYVHNQNADSSDFSPKVAIWQDLANLGAGDIILNDADGPTVTLEDFSKRYGMFDRIDNDGDGIKDYRWEDRNGDGVAETKFYDFDEADPQYGIPSGNMGEIGRKMLAHETTYVVPYGIEGFRERWPDFDDDITLNVTPSLYEDKTISSVILHNEPTNQTITAQLEAQGTLSLPIDNPRYVAFVAAPAKAANYPTPRPINDQVNVNRIVGNLDREGPYAGGEIVKTNYINLFDPEIETLSDVGEIVQNKAKELSELPGAYRIFCAEDEPCDEAAASAHTQEEIEAEMLNTYLLPVITNITDDPLSGFNLKRANTKKLGDALKWKTMDIDEKHHYVLEYYLNGDRNHNAFVNDATLFPAPFGSPTGAGYEATYLVLNGEEDSFEMKFNKDLPEETDERFDPLSQAIGAGDDVPDAEEDGGGEDDDFEFVWLDQFLKELQAFVDGFTSVPNFEQACGFNETIDEAIGGENNGISRVDRFALDVDKAIASIKGGEEITVTGTALDAEGNVVQRSPDIVNLDISGESFYLSSGNGKVVENGKVTFKLRPNEVAGISSLSLISNSGAASNAVQITATNKEVKLVMEQSQIVADGESILTIEAQIYGDDGLPETEGSHDVQFSLDNNLATFVGSSLVSSANGKAIVQIKAGKKSGSVQLSAEVVEGGYPTPKEQVDIVAGPAVSIDVDSDTFLLVANNQSKATLNITLRDKFGNVANNDFSQIAVFSNTIAEIDPKADDNSEIVGAQLPTFEGKASLDLLAKDKVGTANLIFLLFDYDLEEQFIEVGDDWEEIDFNGRVGATASFDVVDKVNMELKVLNKDSQPINSVSLGDDAVVRIGTKLMYKDRLVESYKGPIEFKILTSSLGNFLAPPPKKMVSGELVAANVNFKPGDKTGKVEIQVDIPGFGSKNVSFNITPGEADQISLSASEDTLTTGGDDLFLQASLLDKFGNLITDQAGKRVEFSATEATKDLINFDPAAAISTEGKATTTISSRGLSGKVNVVAEAEGLPASMFSLDLVKRVNAADAEKFSPRSLYISLLGGNFGDELNRSNLAQKMLFSGQVEAISTITSSPDSSKKMFGVDSKGNIALTSDGVEATLVQSDEDLNYHKVIFSDKVEKTELASLFFVPPDESELFLLEEGDGAEKMTENGIYLKPLGPLAEEAKIQAREDGFYIEQGGERKVKIDLKGRVFSSDPLFKVRLAKKEDGIKMQSFGFIITQADQPVLSITFKENFRTNVRRLSVNSSAENLFPGLHIKPLTDAKRYELTSAFSGNSTADALGAYLVDKENTLDVEQAPGFSYTSLESAKNNFGLGFEGDNKHMLLFAAGNSVGESHMPYAADAGIIYGDPTIHLEVEDDLISPGTHYSKDLGKMLFSGQTPIQELIDFDINGDGRDDLLLVYENGIVRLLENVNNKKRFLDRGEILNIYSGVTSLSKIDINNDGLDDLVAGTQEACHADEECVSLFLNIGGGFDRRKLDINLEGAKLYMVKSGDMNDDECEDLVVSDSGGRILIYSNKKEGGECVGLEKEPVESFDFGFSIDQAKNQAENLFINYPGMQAVENKIIQFTLESDTPTPGDAIAAQIQASNAALGANGELAEADIPPLTFPQQFDFVHVPADGIFAESTKQAIDLNGDRVKVGDTINYLITLRNNSGSNISGLRLSDTTPGSMTLVLDSLKCLDPGCSDQLTWQETGTSLRSNIIKNISVPAGGQRTIQYSMTVDLLPKVKFDLGNDFANYPVDDDLLDIMVKPDVNPEGILTYLYSTRLDGEGHAIHKRFESTPDLSEEEQAAPGGISDTIRESSGATEISPELQGELDGLMDEQTQDKDYNGCSDMWNSVMTNYEDSAAAIADGIENALSLLRCSGGGCIPSPYNYAFLVPDGPAPGFAPVGFYPSFPPFLGAPAVLPAVSNNPAPPTIFRLYLSPTITAGLGTAICVGPSSPLQGAPCYAFAAPGGIPGSSGVCDAVLGEIGDAIASAKESVVDPAVGMSAVVTDGSSAVDDSDIDFGTNFADDEDPISAAAKVNIKIPGFPSILTNWVDNQIDEIYNKLLDFPKLYLIFPDIVPFVTGNVNAAKEVNFQSFNDFASSLSAIPLIQIEGKEILVRVPAVSAKEIEKYKEQWKKWKENMKKQLDDRIAFWNCNENPEKQSICDKIVVDINQFMDGVNQLLELMDQLANLPRQILNWRNLEAKYATQIICYLDAVTGFTGGYIKRQQKIVESWIKAARDAIKTFKDWRAILDLTIEYQASCDQCKNDRFSKLALLLQLFAALPEPPVIPLPKWPDLVVDLSQIKTGVQIIWPDVTFRPEPIHLPNLPDITLPEILPSIAIEIPGFDVPDIPTLYLPDLPDLPPLPLPQLPDIPRPPRIPKLPNIVAEIVAKLKPIFKIVCLLKNGLVPVPEAALETEIETLTQPSINAVLPIIKNLAVQWPGIQYDYVREIRITSKVRFDVETEFIYLEAKKGFKIWNDRVEAMVERINRFTTFPYGEVLSKIVQEAIDRQVEEALKNIPDDDLPAGIEIDSNKPSALNETLDEKAIQDFIGLHPEIQEATKNLTEINKMIEDYIATMPEQDYPDVYNLVATQQLLAADDPLLNRSLAEVEASIAMEDLPDDPGVQRIANLRNSLIAYTKNLNESNAMLQDVSNLDDFAKILVQQDGELPRIASTQEPTYIDGGTKEVSFFGPEIEEMITEAAYDGGDERELLAADIEVNQRELAENGSGKAKGPVIGFYVVGRGGVNENVLNYTAELKKQTHVLFKDGDMDDDTDIILSMGGDVYFKENHEQEPDWAEGDLIQSRTEIGEFVNPGGTSVQGVSSPYINEGKADISWVQYSKNTVAYEVVLSNSIYPNERVRGSINRYLVLANPMDSEESKGIFEVLNIDPPAEGEEDSSILVLGNEEKPQVTLELPNGNYYARVYALDSEGRRSFGSTQAIVAPQSCADKEAPFAVIPDNEFELSVFEEMTLDASNSFDSDGEIIKYYLETLPYDAPAGKVFTRLPQRIGKDTNRFIDSDGDVIPWNDMNDPVFTIGPFTNEGDVGKREFILHIVDQSGNSADQKITVNVFVPDITLDPTFGRTKIAKGEVLPHLKDIPFALMRNRLIYRVVDGKLVLVPRTEQVREGVTDINGEYELMDFNLEDLIDVENGAGEVVAEIDPDTGNIGAVADGYRVVIYPAQVPDTPTRMEVVGPKGEVLGSVYLVADPNIDVSVRKESEINKDNYKALRGVNINDIDGEDEFEWISLPANDPANPGGAVLVNKSSNESLAVVDSAGNIIVLNESVTLGVKKNDYKEDPLIILVMVDGEVVGEIYISPEKGTAAGGSGAGSSGGSGQGTQIIAEEDLPFASPHTPSAAAIYRPALLINSAFRDIVTSLDLDEDESFAPEALVTRAQFVRVLLNMLCIVPREPEAYQAYDPGTGYYDIPFNRDELDKDYPYIKEATLLGLVEGYKGDRDVESGLLPFRSQNTISRAEAVKIILRSLEMKGVVDLSGIKEGDPWYGDFFTAAQNLTPYMTGDTVLANNFIITADEALRPGEEMTFEQLLIMVRRVLEIYSCREVDDNNDGLSDFCEAKYKVTDGDADTDGDGISNAQECLYGLNPQSSDAEDDDKDGLSTKSEIFIYKTDPMDKDTDDGGVEDGAEVSNGTNPLVGEDDKGGGSGADGGDEGAGGADGQGDATRSQTVESGLYITPAECNTCPCTSTFLDKADIMRGDIFFPVIFKKYTEPIERIHIFSKGNEVTLTE